ncbi:hypothetical protein O9929_22170 [Vibrio lentus]|nr:hypothetical protein [Vibrio lentus]
MLPELATSSSAGAWQAWQVSSEKAVLTAFFEIITVKTHSL